MTLLDERPVVSAGPLEPGCPVWCVADHRDPFMAGVHISRTAAFAPPSDMETDEEFLAAELWRGGEIEKTFLSLNHAGNGVLLDAAAVDRTIDDLLEFIVRLKALRAHLG